jgi:hypothetical protein
MLFFYGIKLVKPRYYYYVLMILIVIGDGYFSMLPKQTVVPKQTASRHGPELLAAQHLDSSVVTLVRLDQVTNLDSNVLNFSEMLPQGPFCKAGTPKRGAQTCFAF